MNEETISVLLFSVTLAVMIGYAARRHFYGRRHYHLEIGEEQLEVTTPTSEEQARLIEEFLRRYPGRQRPGTPPEVGEGEVFPSIPVDVDEGEESPPTLQKRPNVAKLETFPMPAPPKHAGILSRIRMIHVITLILLFASLWVILSNRYDDAVQKWAFGAVGSIVGFWLGPGRD